MLHDLAQFENANVNARLDAILECSSHERRLRERLKMLPRTSILGAFILGKQITIRATINKDMANEALWILFKMYDKIVENVASA